MKIQVIGCGTAFSKINFNSSFLLEESGQRFLIDCGYQIPAALDHHGIDIKTIDSIYISHAHADHVGGIESVAFQRYDWKGKPCHWSHFGNNCEAPFLYANQKLMCDLWNKTLRGGLESLEGLDADLETYFCTQPLPANDTFWWAGWKCSLIQQVHIMTGSVISNTFGLMMEREGHQTIYFTTDSQHCSPHQLEVFYRKADLIFQDCEVIGFDTTTNISKFMSNVHANYAQLAGTFGCNSTVLPPEIKKKMWLTHYQDCVTQERDCFGYGCDWNARAKHDGFGGICKLGETYEV
jgi:ribonuclease BN (tRNA processing enzyme)